MPYSGHIAISAAEGTMAASSLLLYDMRLPEEAKMPVVEGAAQSESSVSGASAEWAWEVWKRYLGCRSWRCT